MLVLTRRIGESIKIGDDITLTVTDVNGSQVKLGIAAPSDVPILRQELTERPRAEHDRRRGGGLPTLRLPDKGGRRDSKK